MMIAAHGFKQAGHTVTLYHARLPELAPWFPGHDVLPLPDTFPSAAKVIVENDNSPLIATWIQTYRERLSVWYPTYKQGKHAPLHPLDTCFDPHFSMAENISRITSSKDNGITPLPHLQHRRHQRRILIHPESSSPSKDWKASSFCHLFHKLMHAGLSPLFVVHPHEKKKWENKGVAVATTPTLSDLAALVYESALVVGNDSLLGHLASNLNIPTLVLADDPERLQLWRPDWAPSHLLFPPAYLPKRLRQKYWPHFISTQRVLTTTLHIYHFPNVPVPEKSLKR